MKTVEPATIVLFIFLSFPLNAFGAAGFAEQYRAYQSAAGKGNNAFDRKDYPAAVEEYSRVIALSSFESDIYFRRGVALFKSGREIEAVADFDRAILINPRQVQALSYRGLCHERKGEFVAALKDHAEAVAANPKDPSLHNNLAWLYATAGDLQVRDPAKALEHARKATELSGGNNAEILDTLALALFGNGRINEAIETEEKALKLIPGNDRFAQHLHDYRQSKGGAK